MAQTARRDRGVPVGLNSWERGAKLQIRGKLPRSGNASTRHRYALRLTAKCTAGTDTGTPCGGRIPCRTSPLGQGYAIRSAQRRQLARLTALPHHDLSGALEPLQRRAQGALRGAEPARQLARASGRTGLEPFQIFENCCGGSHRCQPILSASRAGANRSALWRDRGDFLPKHPPKLQGVLDGGALPVVVEINPRLLRTRSADTLDLRRQFPFGHHRTAEVRRRGALHA